MHGIVHTPEVLLALASDEIQPVEGSDPVCIEQLLGEADQLLDDLIEEMAPVVESMVILGSIIG